MLRMDGSTDEGRAYGPFPVTPAHPVQSASARLHPRAIGMGGESLRAWGGGGIRFWGLWGEGQVLTMTEVGAFPLVELLGDIRISRSCGLMDVGIR